MPDNLRKYTAQTQTRLIIGGVSLLFIVGGLLIFWLYGPSAAVLGILCIGIGLVPILLVFLVLKVMDWIVKKANQ